MMWKALYVVVRGSAFFSLPGIRKLRDTIYRFYLIAPGINVDSLVRIQKLHLSSRESRFGRDLHVGYGALIDLSGGIDLGDRVTISEGAKIYTHSHPVHTGSQDWRLNPVELTSLSIGDDVWIASNAVVLSSVKKIGKGAIVSAGSVVTNEVNEHEIVAGVPARTIGKRIIHE
jgi:acetyltransferase-like isoleucine patch superfamily enzyme